MRCPRRFASAIFVFVAILALSACGGGDLPEGTVARVGDAGITQVELDRALAQRRAEAEAQGAEFPEAGSAEEGQLRRQALETLVLQRVIDFEARRCGQACRVTAADVTTELDQITESNFGGSREELMTFLERSELTMADARRLLRSGLQEQKLFDDVTRGVRFAEQDARAYYEANPAEFQVPAGRMASHILVETRQEAQALRARVTPQNFAELAGRESTDDGSKARGGQLGPIQRGAFVPEFERAAFALEDGAISAPVRTQFGWHIITVDVNPASTIAFDEAKDRIVSAQLQQARQDRFTEWRDEVVEEWRDRTVYADESLRPAEEPAGSGTTPADSGTTPEPAPTATTP